MCGKLQQKYKMQKLNYSKQKSNMFSVKMIWSESYSMHSIQLRSHCLIGFYNFIKITQLFLLSNLLTPVTLNGTLFVQLCWVACWSWSQMIFNPLISQLGIWAKLEWKKDGGIESKRKLEFEGESETEHASQKRLHTSLLHTGRGHYKSIAHKRKANYKWYDHITQRTPFIDYLPQVNPVTVL